MADFNPLGYTCRQFATTKRMGVTQYDPVDFNIDEKGVVHLGGTGAVQTVNSMTPTSGNIIVAGTTNQLSVENSGSTATLSLPSTLIAPGSFAATTTLTATLGNITATNGNVVLSTAGKGIQVKSGSNARIGVGATLTGGTVTIANTSVTANSIIIPVVTALGTVTAPKPLLITKNSGVGFTVTSSDATDTSTFDWYIVESI